MLSGNRTDRTVVFRFRPFPGCPRRSRTASGGTSGISKRARSEGPPRSPAPANAFRRTGPKRSKSIASSSRSVVLVVRLFMLRGLSRADDADGVRVHLGVHDVKQSSLLGVADEDEARGVERVRIVRAQRVVEGALGVVERDAMLAEVCRRLLRVPLEPHRRYCNTIRGREAAGPSGGRRL